MATSLCSFCPLRQRSGLILVSGQVSRQLFRGPGLVLVSDWMDSRFLTETAQDSTLQCQIIMERNSAASVLDSVCDTQDDKHPYSLFIYFLWSKVIFLKMVQNSWHSSKMLKKILKCLPCYKLMLLFISEANLNLKKIHVIFYFVLLFLFWQSLGLVLVWNPKSLGLVSISTLFSWCLSLGWCGPDCNATLRSRDGFSAFETHGRYKEARQTNKDPVFERLMPLKFCSRCGHCAVGGTWLSLSAWNTSESLKRPTAAEVRLRPERCCFNTVNSV